MRLHLCAVGRLRAGPERNLVDDYLQRLDRTGRPLGLGHRKIGGANPNLWERPSRGGCGDRFELVDRPD